MLQHGGENGQGGVHCARTVTLSPAEEYALYNGGYTVHGDTVVPGQRNCACDICCSLWVQLFERHMRERERES